MGLVWALQWNIFADRSEAVLFLEKLKGQIALALSVRVCVSMRPSVHPLQNLLRYSFEISYMDSSSKIIDTYFFLSLDYPPLRSYAPFEGS